MPLLFIAIAFSGLFITLLCIGDPKRRRSAYVPGEAQSAALRRLFAAAAVAPGVACALSGDAAAFLLWLGGCGVIGWLVTLAFAGANRSADS